MHGRDGERRLGAAELGEELGERATLVQFSSAFCRPCRATWRTLQDVAAMVEGVTHVDIDAEARLALVRELGIVSTPTVLVLDAGAGSSAERRGSRAGPTSSRPWDRRSDCP